jgi:hypothetical protein
MKHQPYRKNDGSYSCRVCQWKFCGYPGKSDCPGVLRIERATDEYKTESQWRKLGFSITVSADNYDAISIVHSTQRYTYFHRDHVAPRGEK